MRELDAAIFRNTVIAQRNFALQFHRGAHRVDDARELDEQPVTGSLDDAAVILGDLGVSDVAAQRGQRRVGPFLVRAHQPRVVGDVGHQDRRQPPLDPLSPGVHDPMLSRFPRLP
jgi:hypothetical protein